MLRAFFSPTASASSTSAMTYPFFVTADISTAEVREGLGEGGKEGGKEGGREERRGGSDEYKRRSEPFFPPPRVLDLILKVADNNVGILTQCVLLEHVPDKSTSAGVKVLQHTDFINVNYTTLHMQTALRKRLQIRAMPMLNTSTTLEKVTNILFASLTLTDGRVQVSASEWRTSRNYSLSHCNRNS